MNFIEQFYYDNKKKVFMFIVVIVVFVLTIFFADNPKEESIYEKKIDSLDYVYTETSEQQADDNEVKSKLPIVNLDSQGIDAVNNDIVNRYAKVVAERDSQIYYEYSINGKILSLLLISLENMDGGDGPSNEYYSYNIDMELKVIIPNSHMMRIKNISEEDIRRNIDNKMKEYYDYEVNKEYVDSTTCDYNCYLKERSLNLDNLEDIVIYINESGKFVVYKSYNLSYNLIMDNDSTIKKPFEFIMN